MVTSTGSAPPPGAPTIAAAAATAALLPYPALVAALERAAVERAEGTIDCPERRVVALSNGATMLSMPAAAVDVAIHKLITVAPNNRAAGLPPIQGQLTIVDPATGRPIAILDGPTVTGRRTAAVSLLGVRLLAATAIARVRLIGTGSQAQHHVDALAALLPGVAIAVVGRRADVVAAFCARNARTGVTIAAARDDDPPADVVIACTTSPTPVHRAPADPRTLVVAVGSFRPDEAEIVAPTVRASFVAVDDPPSARHEAGDLILAGVDWARVVGLADLVRGLEPPAVPRLFKSVGCAAWDLAAARVARSGLA